MWIASPALDTNFLLHSEQNVVADSGSYSDRLINSPSNPFSVWIRSLIIVMDSVSDHCSPLFAIFRLILDSCRVPAGFFRQLEPIPRRAPVFLLFFLLGFQGT